jgi:hypothetical protein
MSVIWAASKARIVLVCTFPAAATRNTSAAAVSSSGRAPAFSRYVWLVRSGRVVWSWCGAGTNFRDHAVLTAS